MLKRLLGHASISVDVAVLLLRLFTLFLVYYGYDKLVHFEEKATYWPDPFHVGPEISLGLTVFAELICPLFVFMGLFTRLALLPAIINMLFAVLIGHTGEPFMAREHAFSFLIPFIVIFLTGPGKYSLDATLRKVS